MDATNLVLKIRTLYPDEAVQGFLVVLVITTVQPQYRVHAVGQAMQVLNNPGLYIDLISRW